MARTGILSSVRGLWLAGSRLAPRTPTAAPARPRGRSESTGNPLDRARARRASALPTHTPGKADRTESIPPAGQRLPSLSMIDAAAAAAAERPEGITPVAGRFGVRRRRPEGSNPWAWGGKKKKIPGVGQGGGVARAGIGRRQLGHLRAQRGGGSRPYAPTAPSPSLPRRAPVAFAPCLSPSISCPPFPSSLGSLACPPSSSLLLCCDPFPEAGLVAWGVVSAGRDLPRRR
ncbi:hypothetical protein PVAP13_9NG146100 [Panicum virgatum]|uniref:Uncharacterized protein n=1 Tax=Panicum virgatum TaxID=38727 RepID=A0A8T0MMB2_PANVG|nr:hypothetical protein PVAP13_9NG146100 [Panicum virgatum]